MKMFKKWMHALTGLLILAIACTDIHAKNSIKSITKKSIQQARYAQQVRNANRRRVQPIAKQFNRQNRSMVMRRGITKRTTTYRRKNATVSTTKQVTASNHGARSLSSNVPDQKTEKYDNKAVSVNNLKEPENVKQTEILAPKQVLPIQKNTGLSTVKNNNALPLDKTKFLGKNDTSILQKNADVGSVPIDIQQKMPVDIQHQDEKVDGKDVVEAQKENLAFLKQLSQLPPDHVEKVLEQMNLNDEEKEEIKDDLANLPALLKEFEKDLEDPNSLAGQSMQGKGWLEWFRKDILNYSWVKMPLALLSTAWNYTGGALLKKCGVEFSKETKKECHEGLFEFCNTFLSVIGLDTPGGALDSFFMATVHSYFPGENTWGNTIAKTALAIGYFGTLRGMPKKAMIWKTVEAFLCTSYCKYFAEGDASYLRGSFFQRYINYFYNYIPECLKHGWIEWYIAHAMGSYKHLTSFIGIGALLAHNAMKSMDKPVVVQAER